MRDEGGFGPPGRGERIAIIILASILSVLALIHFLA